MEYLCALDYSKLKDIDLSNIEIYIKSSLKLGSEGLKPALKKLEREIERRKLK